MWLVRPRLLHTAAVLHAVLVLTPTCHTQARRVARFTCMSLLSMHSDPPAATVLGTVSHCERPPSQTPLLEIDLLPPTFSRLLRNLFQHLPQELPSAQVIRLLESCCFVLATLRAGLSNIILQTHQHKLYHRSYLFASALDSTLNSSPLHESRNQPASKRETPVSLYAHQHTHLFRSISVPVSVVVSSYHTEKT